MGFEVRKVAPGWSHPTDAAGRFVQLLDGSRQAERITCWDQGARMWQQGLCSDGQDGWREIAAEDRGMPYEEWAGPRPDPADAMPHWPADVASRVMMYQNAAEGEPVSPPCRTPEALARWLVRNRIETLPGTLASYDAWLAVARGGYAASFVIGPCGDVVDGVAAAQPGG